MKLAFLVLTLIAGTAFAEEVNFVGNYDKQVKEAQFDRGTVSQGGRGPASVSTEIQETNVKKKGTLQKEGDHYHDTLIQPKY